MKINIIALPLCLALVFGAGEVAAQGATGNEPAAPQQLDRPAGPAQSEVRSPASRLSNVANVASQAAREMSYSELVDELEAGNIRAVTITGQQVTAQMQNGSVGRTYVPDEADFVQRLQGHDVAITAKPSGSQGGFSALLVWLFPLLLLFGLWYFIMRQMRGGGGGGGGVGSQVMDFKRSKAKLLDRTNGRTTFKDVAGIEEAKEDLEEIVDFLRDPMKFRRLGGRIPTGVLLVGAPGTGKTLVARAVAGEADVAFFSISGSDFVEMFVGVGASRVRDMFEQAKKSAPCIVFIDEIDALGRRRGAGVGGGNDEREQTLNQLLVEMDGFESSQGVIVIAATNRPDVLDPALLRPGRFDRQVVVHKPDLAGRTQILRVHTRKVPLGPDVDLKTVARGTPGFSGAELANLVNEAALLAARRSKSRVGMAEFEDAKDKLIMGAERGTLVMSEEERRLTAYHEAGHALVALHMPASDPIHKATIIPRGQSLGMVARLPNGDRMALTRAKCRADLAVAMGGRVAEELVFGADTATSSASADIRMATDLSRAMVTRFGMSPRLGPLTYGEDDQEVFVGRSVTRQKNVSDRTQKLVDEEIKAFVHYGYETARQILSERLDELHRLAHGLLENETLSGAEIRALADGDGSALARSNGAEGHDGPAAGM